MPKPKISVIIPVFRGPGTLDKVIEKLLKEKVDKEIIVVIDEPTKESTKIVKKYRRKVKFILNKKRKGKALAANQAVKIAKSDILLFLDDDIEVGSKNFLKNVIDEMKDADVMEIKKEVVRKNLLSKLTYYEYIGFNIGAWLVSKYTKECPAVNGAAFAMKKKVVEDAGMFRKVVSEDLDIAVRAFIKGYKFKYTTKAFVKVHAHTSWKKWFTQRKRWVIGASLWFKEWWKEILKKSAKRPQIYLPALLFTYPGFIVFSINSLIPDIWTYKLLMVLAMFLSIKFSIIIPFLSTAISTVSLVKAIVASLIGFFVFGATFYLISRKLKFRTFKMHEFFVYYFFYSPITAISQIIALLIVVIFGKIPKLKDWKI